MHYECEHVRIRILQNNSTSDLSCSSLCSSTTTCTKNNVTFSADILCLTKNGKCPPAKDCMEEKVEITENISKEIIVPANDLRDNGGVSRD